MIPVERTPISVLYLHSTGALGGASRSLLELVRGFPEQAVDAHLVSPRGRVPAAMRAAGVPVVEATGMSQFDDTRYNHYRGRRWFLLVREFLYLPFTASALVRARARWRRIDLLHANEITLLPACVLARIVFRRPLVVHVRSVQRGVSHGARARIIRWFLRKHAAALIAIDDTVVRSLPGGLKAHVIHNSFTPDLRPDDDLRPRFGDGTNRVPRLRVGMVGRFLRFKGVMEFV
jgi:hypothetical protein